MDIDALMSADKCKDEVVSVPEPRFRIETRIRGAVFVRKSGNKQNTLSFLSSTKRKERNLPRLLREGPLSFFS